MFKLTVSFELKAFNFKLSCNAEVVFMLLKKLNSSRKAYICIRHCGCLSKNVSIKARLADLFIAWMEDLIDLIEGLIFDF